MLASCLIFETAVHRAWAEPYPTWWIKTPNITQALSTCIPTLPNALVAQWEQSLWHQVSKSCQKPSQQRGDFYYKTFILVYFQAILKFRSKTKQILICLINHMKYIEVFLMQILRKSWNNYYEWIITHSKICATSNLIQILYTYFLPNIALFK